MNQNDFLQTLSNYRASIVKTLPAYISKRLTDDESLADELSLMLYSRDVLARALASADVSAQTHLSEIEQLDRQLLNLKDALLPLVPFYAQLRQRKPRPRSQWWYYLDEVVSSPPVEKKTSINYWLPLTPQPTP